MDNKHKYTSNVVVIIATSMRRTDLLINRALLSVYNQINVNPLCIYIIDDNSDTEEFYRIKKQVKAFRQSFFSKGETKLQQNIFHTVVMRNIRTQGHSGAGAWNTAAEHAFRHYTNGRKTYLAFLDDDDEWHSHYLSSCLSRVDSITESYVPAVICGFTRVGKNIKQVVQITQEKLVVNTFLVGNPGWQGSNTFVEIKSFWEAGGFDEALPSTLDRDLAIRLIDICQFKRVSIQVIDKLLVNHYIHDNERVTTNNLSKRKGLDIFYSKHLPRMSGEIKAQSLVRAKKLFNYKLLNNEFREACTDDQSIELLFKDESAVPIIFGIVSSSSSNVSKQLASLDKQLKLQPQFNGKCTYLLLTNGSNEESIFKIAKEFNQSKFKIILICQESQKGLLAGFPHHHLYKNESLDSKSIAYSRSLVHYCCWKKLQVKNEHDQLAVILDDDLLFESVIESNKGYEVKSLCFLGKLSKLRQNAGADILISKYSGSPPLPFYSTLRTQLIDLYYLTTYILHAPFSMKLKELYRYEKTSKDDYYYDLSSKNFSFLELPQIDGLLTNSCTRKKGINLIKGFIENLVYESHTTRYLTTAFSDWKSVELSDSYLRGGIAIYLNLDLLKDIPNISPVINSERGFRSRRSDFIASLATKEIFNKKIMNVSFPMMHDRNHTNKPCKLSSSKLSSDILGLCFYRVFKLKLEQPEISDKKVNATFDHELKKIIGKLKTNNLRIISLTKLITCNLEQYRDLLIEKGKAKEINLLTEMIKNIQFIENEYATRKFKDQLRAVEKELLNFDSGLKVKKTISKYQSIHFNQRGYL